jgi:class 3 adenylate cyclase/predicted ATPase
MDVAAWLQELGLAQYQAAFASHDIDTTILPDLTAEDLINVGVTSIGHRRRLLTAIAALSGSTAAEHAAPPVAAPASPMASASGSDAERRQLTVMFCDIVGSTALSTRFDPEDLRDIIRTYHNAVAQAVVRFDGFIAQYLGDGALIYFGYPNAHEDDAERAIRAGLETLTVVTNLAVPVRLQIRIGIATGLVVVGDLVGQGAAKERAVMGETPNLAARLQALAEPDSIVVAHTTRQQVGNLFELADLGLKELAGFAKAQTVWRVVGESGVLSRYEALRSGTSPLVGREEELGRLMRRWTIAAAGEGQVVLLFGEPGIGKSRLTASVMGRLEQAPHVRLRYFCAPHRQDSALWPVISQIARAAGFADDDIAEVRSAKLRALIGPASSDADSVALLCELMSVPGPAPSANLSPARRREALFDAILGLLDDVARGRPVLMIFEDVHWIDPTSRELLDLTIDRIRRLPVLLLITFRPEFRSPWSGHAHVSSMTLNRLGAREGETLVRSLAGNAALAAATVAEIIERTDGVPLFVEELTKAVLEDGGRSQAILALVPAASHVVPATLHAALMARLDRLGAAAKEVAQVGAVLGREFTFELIEAVTQRHDSALQTGLALLSEAELLFCRGTPPHASYMFKHALVQDAAYGSLLRGRRQDLHRQAAQALLRSFTETVERQPDVLAHHWSEAGETAAAVAQWLTAGRVYASRSAHIEASGYFNRALAALATLPVTAERNALEIDLQLALAASIIVMEGFTLPDSGTPDLGQVYARARDLAEQQHDATKLFIALWGQWVTTQLRGQFGAARDFSQQLLILTRSNIDDGLQLQAHHSAWTTAQWTGEPAACFRHVEAGLRLYVSDRHRAHVATFGGHDPGVCGNFVGGFASFLLGYPERARDLCNNAIRLAQDVSHPFSVALAHSFASLNAQFRRDAEAALHHINAAEALATEQRLALLFDPRILRGGAVAAPDLARESSVQIREGLAARAAGSGLARPFSLGLLCNALRAAGEIGGAEAAIAEALALVDRTGERWWEAELWRLQALLQIERRNLEEADATLRRAIGLAQRQEAKSLELRAATSLAHLWFERGRRREAHDLLEPVYRWFTEGFEMPDLKEAKALLDSL